MLSLKRKIFVQRYIYGEVTELTNIYFFFTSQLSKEKISVVGEEQPREFLYKLIMIMIELIDFMKGGGRERR